MQNVIADKIPHKSPRRQKVASNASLQLILLIFAHTLIESVSALLDCNNAMFPQLFGASSESSGDKIMALDAHRGHNTVVAGGYFTNKNLARDETGAFDVGYQDHDKAKYPIIILYPNKSNWTKTPSFHTVRYDGEDAILDIAVYQSYFAGGDFYEARELWNIPDWDPSSKFFFAAVAATDNGDFDLDKTQRLFIFMVTLNVDGNDVEYTLALHKQFSFTMPYDFSYTEYNSNYLTFRSWTRDDDNSVDGQGHYKSRPIVTLTYPMEGFQPDNILQIALLTPFYEGSTETYNQILIKTELASDGQKIDVQALNWYDNYLFAAGGFLDSSDVRHSYIQKFDLHDFLPWNEISRNSEVQGSPLTIDVTNNSAQTAKFYMINQYGTSILKATMAPLGTHRLGQSYTEKAYYAVSHDNPNVRLTVGGEGVYTTKLDDVELSIDKWQNEYLWLVEQPGGNLNFRDITFYETIDGNKFMVAIAYESISGVMICRFRIAQDEVPSLPSSATDDDMMEWVYNWGYTLTQVPIPVSMQCSSTGECHIVTWHYESVTTEHILSYNVVQLPTATGIPESNGTSKYLRFANTNIGEWNLFNAKAYLPYEGASAYKLIYSVGTKAYYWLDAASTQRNTINSSMFSVIFEGRSHNCNVIDDWTNNSRSIQQMSNQVLVTTDAINYAVTLDSDPLDDQPFTVSSIDIHIQESLTHNGADLLPTEWMKCDPTSNLNVYFQNGVSSTFTFQQRQPINAYVTDGVSLGNGSDTVLQVHYEHTSDVGVYTVACLDPIIYKEVFVKYDASQNDPDNAIFIGEREDITCSAIGEPPICGQPTKECALEQVAKQILASKTDTPQGISIEIQATQEARLVNETILISYRAYRRNMQEVFNYLYVTFECYGQDSCRISSTENACEEIKISDRCFDISDGATDSGGVGCEWYRDNQGGCSLYDDSDFTSSELCCGCSGGVECLDTGGDGQCLEELIFDEDGPCDQMDFACRIEFALELAESQNSDAELITVKVEQDSGSSNNIDENSGPFLIDGDTLEEMYEQLDELSDEAIDNDIDLMQDIVDSDYWGNGHNAQSNHNEIAEQKGAAQWKSGEQKGGEREDDYNDGQDDQNSAQIDPDEVEEQQGSDSQDEDISAQNGLDEVGELTDSKGQEESQGQETVLEIDLCYQAGECDQFGNLITEDGYYDENTKWIDMTIFEPDPEMLDLVEIAMWQTSHLVKIGPILPEAFEDNYNEDIAVEASTFDIKDWADEQGQTKQRIDEDDNQATMMLTLADIYSVPKIKKVDVHGHITLKFSSELISLYYKELQRRFLWLYTEGNDDRRRLADTENVNEEPNENPNDQSNQEIENIMICNLLKMTNSLRVELIPSATDMEMKAFNWTVQYIATQDLVFNFTFEHPQYISMGQNPDTMKIMFLNTPHYLMPDDPRLTAIPNGWQTMIKLPPQTEPVQMNEEISLQDGENGMMALIATNGWMSFAFGVSMQPLFDMINSLQITALLPLTSVTLPANAVSLFGVIMTIVAFDYFPLYDPGYTETESYNEKFAWFGKDSINFIDGLGSFLICLFILMLAQTFLIIGIYFGIIRMFEPFLQHQTLVSRISTTIKRNKWIRNNLFPVAIKQSWILIILEAYIEVLLGSFISFKMFEIRKFWNNWDKFAEAVHFLGMAAAICFFILVMWFVFIKVVPLNLKNKMELKQLYLQQIDATRGEVIITQRKNTLFTSKSYFQKSPTLILSMTYHLKRLISSRIKEDEQVMMNMSDIKEEEYEVYEPLLAGLKTHERLASSYYILFLCRRVILVFTIFMLDTPELLFAQMQVFMLSSLGILVYNCAANPFESRYETVKEVLNELNVLFVAYCALQLLYTSYDALMMHKVGFMMICVILTGVVLNIIVIIVQLFRELKRKFLHWKQQRVVKRRQKESSNIVKKLKGKKHSAITPKQKTSFRKLHSTSVVTKSLKDHGVNLISIKSSNWAEEQKQINEESVQMSESISDRLIPVPIRMQKYKTEEKHTDMLVLHDTQKHLFSRQIQDMSSENSVMSRENSVMSRENSAISRLNVEEMKAERESCQSHRKTLNDIMIIPEANSPSKIVQRDFGINFKYDLMFRGGDHIVEREDEMIETSMIERGIRILSIQEPMIQNVHDFNPEQSSHSLISPFEVPEEQEVEDDENRKTSKLYKYDIPDNDEIDSQVPASPASKVERPTTEQRSPTDRLAQ